ncbi:MAG TPA: methyltransferase domain-containing protein [Acidimicrobiales bacterium]|nr:methyltransferase domain-containing protein [Acidimicrobiales bacterium]
MSGALPALPFADATFAGVTANFVVNHVGEPRAAVRELGRVLADDGRLVITIWPAGGAAWQSPVDEVFATSGAASVASARLPEDRDFPRSIAGLKGLIDEVGLEVHEAGELHWTWRVDPTDLWAGIAGGIATPGRTYLAQTPEVRARIERGFLPQRAARSMTDTWPSRQ